jgi:hypothetical protein
LYNRGNINRFEFVENRIHEKISRRSPEPEELRKKAGLAGLIGIRKRQQYEVTAMSAELKQKIQDLKGRLLALKEHL